MKRKWIVTAWFLICVLLAGCSPQLGEGGVSSVTSQIEQGAEKEMEDISYIQKKGTLVVGITEFAPMDYRNESGEWVGFDADMARRIAEALGVSIQFVTIEWGNKLLELENKSVDCLWNGMTITEEITQGASTTVPYAKNAQVVVLTEENAQKYRQKELTLEELTFAVEEGSAGQKALEERGLAFRTVSAQTDALMEVAAGTSDACVIDLLMAGSAIGEGTDYTSLTEAAQLTEEFYGVGVRKNSDLAEFINQQFLKLYQDGTMEQLAKQYGISENLLPQQE